MRLAFFGGAIALLGGATVLCTSGWPGRLPLHLALFVAAGLVWALTLLALPRLPRAPGRREVVLLAAVAVLLRLPAWLAPPAHSDDVYRYAWDGRVARAGINPYRHAPADAELAPLREGVRLEKPEYEREPARPTAARGPLWARINNPDLPTIYPPAAQIIFYLSTFLPAGPILSLKIIFALFDFAIFALLYRLLARRGDDPRYALAWGWSPLVAIELGQNAHLDGVPILGLCAALFAWESGRRRLAGALLGAATAAKLITAPLFLVFRSLRAWAAAALVVAVLALPYLGAGAAMGGSTGEFARRWRGNDGAYALVQAAFDRAVCRWLDAPPVPKDGPGPACTRPLDIWPHFTVARIVTGRSYRAAIYPDELSSFCARMVAGAILTAILIWVLYRRKQPIEGSEWILGALLLWTPALHPWYATWLLPFVALKRRRAWIALAALVPLGYAPLHAWLGGAPWRDPIWTRLVLHGACWALLLHDALGRRARETLPPAPAG